MEVETRRMMRLSVLCFVLGGVSPRTDSKQRSWHFIIGAALPVFELSSNNEVFCFI
jgi:hypothetical protein